MDKDTLTVRNIVSGNFISFNEVQWLKALFPIFITLSGIVINFKDEQR